MVLHSSSICLLERAFLFNKCMWEGESPLGNEVWVLSGLRRALLLAKSSPAADISLPSFGARFLLEGCSDLWEMHHLLWELPPCTTSLGNHSGSRHLQGVVLPGGKTHSAPISLGGSIPRNWGKKAGFPSATTSLPMSSSRRGCKGAAEHPSRR